MLPQRYWRLTDSILKEIENSQAPELQRSRDIVSDFRHRRLYKLGGELLVPPASVLHAPHVRKIARTK